MQGSKVGGTRSPTLRRTKVKPAMKLKSWVQSAPVATYHRKMAVKSNYIGELLLDFRINFGLILN